MQFDISEDLKPDRKKAGYKSRFNLTRIMNITLFVLILFYSFWTFIESQKVMKEINEKKETIAKLKQIYTGIANENEKIRILLKEIRNERDGNQYIIKINEQNHFKNLSEKIKKEYNDREIPFIYSKKFFWILFGFVLIAIIRFLYLEYTHRQNLKHPKFK